MKFVSITLYLIPTAALIDSQSVRTAGNGAIRGYDTGKKIRDASGICSWTRLDSCSSTWSTVLRSRTETAEDIRMDSKDLGRRRLRRSSDRMGIQS
ncbi:hypothetical protein MLD52_18860 [Puniceicoccaceae bacterium K14]|nr:hypothetical protein [Puniceicoccaceae bacterium K14]